jgi:hypothetical protein
LFLITSPLIHTKHDLTLIDIDCVLFVLYMGKHMDKQMDKHAAKHTDKHIGKHMDKHMDRK